MILSRGTLKTLGVGFNATFKGALSSAVSQRALIATDVTSTNSQNEYGWLNAIPRVRKWVGDRIVHRLSASGYTIRNEDWEITLAVKKNDVEDDNLGIYTPMLQQMGSSTVSHYDELSFQQLANGFSNLCYDGQNFFDTDHPILDENGAETTFANTDGGAGTAWFLVPKNVLLKPVVLQKRQDFNFVSKDAPNDEGVFWQKEFTYGADARHAVGYSLPQLCWGSKQTLDATHFNTALQKMQEMKGDHGTRLGMNEFTLLVPPSLRVAANAIVVAQKLDGGGDNTNYKAADLVVSPWLA